MVKITCRHCNGTGKANLPDAAARVLAAVPRDRFVTTKAIHASIPEMAQFGQNAVVNQLNVLERNKLVAFQEIGRAKVWKRIK